MDPEKALAHAGPGHHLVMATYGPRENPHNVAVECIDCGEVVVDADVHQDEDEAPQVWTVTIYPWDGDPASSTFVFSSREDGEAFATYANDTYPKHGLSGNLTEPVEAWQRDVDTLEASLTRLRYLMGDE